MRTKEQRAAYMREYRAKHHQELIEYRREWWKKTGEMVNERRRHRYARDPEYRKAELERNWRYKHHVK